MSAFLTDADVRERLRATKPYVGADYSAGVVHGLLVTVTPQDWRVRTRGRLIASGPERGARGFAKAREAAEGMK